jgi:bifunctional non-homologous end joining protein LigD
MGIEDYRRKRDFRATPEPEPGAEPGGRGNGFVVHRHEARSLHYDLRIEADGVLACWAVPKGFSYAPSDKRLAVRTEDHPLAYRRFEGTIPAGQYGAGTMKIWDSGEYELRKAPSIAKALAQGEVKLELRGRRLRGEWHLVQTKAEEGKNWLLFKARDRYAGSGSDLFGGADLSRAARRPLPRGVAPMEPSPGQRPFTDAGWLFEPAFDGRRIVARIEGSKVSLRAGTEDLADRLPAIVKALASVRAEAALLDGVVVALDARGRPSAEALGRELGSGGAATVLYLFDALYAEEWDLRPVPLRERKTVLRALLPESARLFLVDAVAEKGEELARAAAASGLGSIVGKRAGSPYRGGLSDDWLLIPVSAALARGPRPAPRTAAGRPTVAISHPRKVYWPEQGYTKGDLVAYYDGVAAVLLPYLRDRPLHLYRWPDGIRGKSFYQKQLPEDLLERIETVNVARDGEQPVRYAMCNDRSTLLTLVNTGSIDLHPWLSRRGSLDSPDWAVIDLDPKGAPFEQVIKVARIVGRLLRGLGLEPYLKTSGSTGLHVCIPLEPGYTYDQARMFCEAVARLVVRDHADIATVERVVARRDGRVYVDFLQNRREQTVVPPYVVRPVEAASVSMPLAWDELEGDLHVGDFTLATALPRIERAGDLFRTALNAPQSLAPAIEALGTYLG